MGLITEILDAIKLLSKSTVRYSGINKALQQKLKMNINLIKRINHSNLNHEDIRNLANELHCNEIQEFLLLHIKAQRWVCKNKVTPSLLQKIKAKRTIGCYLDEVLEKADLKHNDLLTTSDSAPIKSSKTRFTNLKKDYTIALRLLQRVK